MKNWMFFALIALIYVSCEKIIAEDISGITPIMIVPTTDDTVSVNPVLFKWEPITGADAYRLEVVSPSFDAINAFVLDSMISSTEFYLPLDSNVYEFRLTATNSGYNSKIAGPFKIWVGIAASGIGNGVSLNSPSDGNYVNGSFSKIFSWNNLIGATSYEYSLRRGTSFAGGALLNIQANLSTSTYTDTVTFSEGTYFWGVKAFIGSSETPYSIRRLNVDLTDPNVPVLSVPSDQQLVNSGSVTFSWNNGNDPGTVQSPVNSTIEVASDVNFTNIVTTDAVLNAGTADLELTTGIYYWRVTNMDQAGNSSAASNIFLLSVN